MSKIANKQMRENLQKIQNEVLKIEKAGFDTQTLRHLLSKMDNDFEKNEFLQNRFSKDKEIAINILKETVEELKIQKELVERKSDELSHNLHALQLSYHELEQFAYIASHDLKNPLRNIGSYAQLLKRRYKDKIDADANDFIEFIVTSAQTMNDIISDLLEYSTIDREKELNRVEFTKVIELVAMNLKEQMMQTGAELLVDDDLPELWVRRSGIIQLFQNLIENAIKYRSEKKPVIQIKGNILEDGKTWRFLIIDNGVGLNTEYSEKAFQPFQRINQRDRPGLGMGLAICRKVVKLHGGDIGFESNIDPVTNENLGGTCFYFTLPQP